MNDDNGANMKDDSKHDDDFYQRTIGPLDEGVALPDRDLMAAARAAAGEAFAAGEDLDESANVIQTNRSRKMLTYVKSVAALMAAAAIFVIAFLPNGATASVNLGDVLDRVCQSKSFKLLIKQSGDQSEVLVAGGSVRWQDSDQRYRIASGSRLWQIDEAENTVADIENPWGGDGGSIDLLALVGSRSTDSLRALEVSEQAQHAGTLCNVFVFEPDPSTSDLTLRCYTDAQTDELYTIACWDPGVDPATQPPLAELRLVKRNIDIDEDLFVVGKSLSKDGRIGQIANTQGLVQIRPKAYKRWTPVAGPVVLKRGDWIRTDARGANAATIGLTAGHRVILGPGSLIEITSPQAVVLHRGEANFSSGAVAEEALELSAGGESMVSIEPQGTRHFAVDGDSKLVRRDDQPKWLAGFLGSSNDESLGSLITKIDGRDVPLTVGYHKVKVEIRDQIARTTIEESFVNHTNRRLEGQFHFPLPQDASISGFGMWIGGELIEADVVEKQRAREIYETILRERRDPGLLEWAGGNIFKARVFPIEAHSEKRIKIVYTQVLPMRANKYRYAYALRSELLQKTPLRELSLDVSVSSALPLKSVTCPTHSVRADLTDHAASVEFSAQEFTPRRDFEIVCEVGQQDSDVVVVPHQRGADGYFLAQITPPSAVGSWQRDVLPNGDPVNVLMVCDTSGSMDRQTRKTQAEFVASVLSTLGEEDRFNIASCDVDTLWFSDESVAADDDAKDKVAAWLNERDSLGWTDLDRMAEVVSAEVDSQPEGQPEGRRTHVIYVGDGIATARDADPQACAGRLRRVFADVDGVTFHCVSIGSSFESGVLQALASIGGGSVRQIDGEQTAQRTAFELLNEMMQPGLTDLKIEFRGIEVAAVYPERLPNLAAGTQQIIVGRYLPADEVSGEGESGEIVITGKRNGESVRYASRITLDNAESGNSFVPRLWARGHLDHLLQQGSNDFIQGEVIALSQAFHIMTPYTSLLVLETDEDRERFGVKRVFEMRDGEQFFADGTSKASFELLQKQMKVAGNWRLELRRQVLRELARLGRERLAGTQGYRAGLGLRHPVVTMLNGQSRSDMTFGNFAGEESEILGGFGGGSGGGFGDEMRKLNVSSSEFQKYRNSVTGDFDGRFGDSLQDAREGLGVERLREQNKSFDGLDFQSALVGDFEEDESQFDHPTSGPSFESPLGRKSQFGFRVDGAFQAMRSGQSFLSFGASATSKESGAIGRSGRYNQSTAWIDSLAPALAGAPAKSKPVASKWADEISRIVGPLLQPIEIADDQGLEISLTQGSTVNVELTNGRRWLKTPLTVGGGHMIDWCDDQHRANASRAWKIGRRRKATPADISEYQPGRRPWTGDEIVRAYGGWSAEIKEGADGNENELTLLLTAPKNLGQQTVELTIDRDRNVVLSHNRTQDGKVVSRSTYTDHVQVAGVWWPETIKDFDGNDRVTREVTQKVKVLSEKAFADRYASLKPNEATYQIIDFPTPTVSQARAKSRAGTAGFDDYLVLILDACRIQNWESAFESFEKMKAIAPEKRCMEHIRRQLLVVARRNGEALESCRKELERLVEVDEVDEMYGAFIASALSNMAMSFTDFNERLELLEIAKPIYTRSKQLSQWRQYQVYCLQGLNRIEELITLQRQMAEATPDKYSVHTALAQTLSNAGEYDAGVEWLEKQISRGDQWQTHELDQLYSTATSILHNKNQYAKLFDLLERWMETKTNNSYAYGRYLAALVSLDRVEKADAVARRWINESMRDEKLSDPELTQLRAAISYAIGTAHHGHYRQWMEPKWYKPLLKTAEFFLKHEHNYSVVNEILSNSHYSWTEQAKRGYRSAAGMLKNSAAEMKVGKVNSLVNLVREFNELEKDDWLQIAKTLRDRWEDVGNGQEDGQDDDSVRRTLGQTVARIYANHADAEDHVAFLQERLNRSIVEEDGRVHLQQLWNSLFAAILELPWSEKVEDAAFDLLSNASFSDDPTVILLVRIDRLQQLSDAMKNGVFAVLDRQLRSHGHPEKSTRQELAKRRAEMGRKAIEHVVSRLAAEQEKLRQIRENELYDGLRAEFVQWMKLEHMHFSVLSADVAADDLYGAEGDLGVVVKACREMMGEQPLMALADVADAEEGDEKTDFLIQFKQLRQRRACTILSHIAVRKSAPETLPDDVLEYVRRGIELSEEDSAHWLNHYRTLLLALDRVEELEQSLRKSLRESDDPATLQMMLARLLAEQGNIKDAIELAEAAGKTATLSPAELSVLANWYLAADREEDYRQARIDKFAMTHEYQISNWLDQRLQPWQRTDRDLPSELEEDVLFAFQALFKKSQSPENYCYQLRSYYAGCRDFRLLQMVPDAVVGRTPQQIYPFLTELNSQVLSEVRNEATVDKIFERINELREKQATVTDLRALDLLEAMVERRAAEVLNQPGPHVEAAIAAMRRAFDREWAAGERLQMAKFLMDMGNVTNPKLAIEQLREVRELHSNVEVGTDTHFQMSWSYAQVLKWSVKQAEAIRVMEVALRQYHESNEPGLPVGLNTPLDGYVGLLEGINRFAAAEDLLFTELDQVRNQAQKIWMKKRINRSRLKAYSNGGRIKLGEGTELYRNLLDSLLEEATRFDQNYGYSVLETIESVFKNKNRRDAETFKDDLKTYAYEQFPELAKRINNNYANTIDQVADLVHDELGPKEGVRFLVTRLENYPERYRGTHYEGWEHLAYDLGRWRKEAGNLGPLNKRLLKLALAHLRKELIVRDYSRTEMMNANSAIFWSEKEGDFAVVADEVAAEYKDSAAVVVRVGKYLFDRLKHHDRAIVLLDDARARGILSETQELSLVYRLRDRQRWQEVVTLLEPWVAKRAKNIKYRGLLIKALSLSKQERKRDEILAETEAYLRDENLWTEVNVAMLAKYVYQGKMYKVAVRLYDELIPMYQRSRSNPSAQDDITRGYISILGGSNRLSTYYQNLSRSHVRLGNSIAAVDAAAGGIVARGQDRHQRKTASSTLEYAMFHFKDRDKLAAHLDRQAEETGQDSAILRKALGVSLLGKNEFEAAIVQLQIAVELQPTDAETHLKLIKAFDKAGRKDEATKQMFRQLDFDRHNLEVYKQLAKRLQNDDSLAERAATSLVEAAPLEASHHQALAELRQEQNRWDDAIDHWQHVAELRKLEPTGLIKLATAQVHEKKWGDARATIKKLNQREWPERFDELDDQIRKLQKRLRK